MLGNFSFGDYFKEEAIPWAWEFLTKELGIDPARLNISIYRDDEEAYRIWREKVGLADSRIQRFGPVENYWPSDVQEQGPNGPCGPCSEIFFDRGEEFGCGSPSCNLNCDCRRHVEFWNLVFTQFERKSDGSLVPRTSTLDEPRAPAALVHGRTASSRSTSSRPSSGRSPV